MSVDTLKTLLMKMASPSQIAYLAQASSYSAGSHWNSGWSLNTSGIPTNGTTPTTPAVPTNATAGSLGQLDWSGAAGTTEQRAWLKRGRSTGNVQGMFALVDRLSHMGGLDGTNTGAQAVNTAALTRSTNGIGVWAAVEIYTAIGATATTATVSYTNEAGTAGRTSPAFPLGGTNADIQRAVLTIPLQSGDLGVKSVQSITLAATTGTIGNFGITLYRTLGMWPCMFNGVSMRGEPHDVAGSMPVIPAGAALQWLHFGAGTVNSTITADLYLFED